MQAVMDVLAWTFRVAARGRWPKHNFRGERMDASLLRGQMAGQPLFGVSGAGKVIKGILCEVSADLDEYAKTFGLCHYASTYPCFSCFRPLSELGARTGRPPVRKRDHQWLLDSAEASFVQVPITDAVVPALKRHCKGVRTKAGQIVQRRFDEIPGLKRGDRIEPAVRGYVDAWHNESCADYPEDRRSLLVYRRQKHGLLFFSRLFAIPGVQPGIKGLTLQHMLYDQMHVMELGILAYFMGDVLWRLIRLEFFGPFSEKTMIPWTLP